MITRLSANELRSLAAQLDALDQIHKAGGDHVPSGTTLAMNGKPLAYLYWWEDKQTYLAEFLDFVPGKPKSQT